MNRYTLELLVDKLFDRISDNPVRWALGTMATGIIFGGIIFSLAEADTSIPDGMWWAFVSMTTVGYGDISPATTGIRILATGVIFSGILAVAIITGALGGRIAQRRMQGHSHESTEELHDDVHWALESMDNIRDCLTYVRDELERREKADVNQRQEGAT
jgi:hypothetical protein